jgi:hypothetical protein
MTDNAVQFILNPVYAQQNVFNKSLYLPNNTVWLKAASSDIQEHFTHNVYETTGLLLGISKTRLQDLIHKVWIIPADLLSSMQVRQRFQECDRHSTLLIIHSPKTACNVPSEFLLVAAGALSYL